jgi:chromosome segregation ATPase
LSVTYTHDGKLISCGRDNQVTSWNAEGNKVKSFQFDGELPLRTVFAHDGERVIATDFGGRVAVWGAKDAKRLGDLEGNPLPLAERLTHAEKRLTELQAQAKQTNSELAKAEASFAKAKTDLDAANKAVEKAKTDQQASEDLVVKLKEEAAKVQPQLLTQVFPPPEHEKKLADARAARAKARENTTNVLAAIETRKKELETAESKLTEAKAKDPAKLVPAAKAEVAKWKAALAQTDLFRARQSLSTLRRELEAYNAVVAERKSALDKASDTEKAKIESEIKAAEATVKKLNADLSSQEAKVKKLASDLQQIKPTQLSSR